LNIRFLGIHALPVFPVFEIHKSNEKYQHGANATNSSYCNKCVKRYSRNSNCIIVMSWCNHILMLCDTHRSYSESSRKRRIPATTFEVRLILVWTICAHFLCHGRKKKQQDEAEKTGDSFRQWLPKESV